MTFRQRPGGILTMNAHSAQRSPLDWRKTWLTRHSNSHAKIGKTIVFWMEHEDFLYPKIKKYQGKNPSPRVACIIVTASTSVFRIS